MRTCTVCTNPQRPEIDAALLASGAERTIADQYGLSKTSVHRHRENHLSKAIQKVEAKLERKTERQVLSLYEKIDLLADKTLRIAEIAENKKDAKSLVPPIR